MGKMLTIKEVAEKLRISTASVLNCIKDHRIHAVRIPGTKKWLIDEESLKKLMGTSINIFLTEIPIVSV